MLSSLPILSGLIWLPILGGLAMFNLKQDKSCQRFALIISVISLALALVLLTNFQLGTAAMQWRESHAWLANLGIYYALGVDGFSLPLIILTCFMGLLVVLAAKPSNAKRLPLYLSSFLIMQGLICGALAALDAILFYVFWESMLLPMFLIIGIWGSQNRLYATIKFFLYTFLGSVLLLVSIIYLHLQALALDLPLEETFSILTFQALPLSHIAQQWLFFAFLIAFAVKVPMWPVHTWLPDAHVEAPTGGSVILAAILLKMGGYGMLRFLMPIVPDAAYDYAGFVIILSLIAIIYISLVALVQKDMKKLIAYSSIAHMGFVTLGFFAVFFLTLNPETRTAANLGLNGGMVQMISHGFVSAALFLCVGVLYERLHSRQIKDYGGVVNSMPIFASFFMLFALANVGLPGTSGFVGEFLVILAAFQAKVWFALIAATILFLGAGYTLWMYKRVVLGGIQSAAVSGFPDLSHSEKFIFVLLALSILWLGIWPAPLLDLIQASTDHLIDQLMNSKVAGG